MKPYAPYSLLQHDSFKLKVLRVYVGIWVSKDLFMSLERLPAVLLCWERRDTVAPLPNKACSLLIWATECVLIFPGCETQFKHVRVRRAASLWKLLFVQQSATKIKHFCFRLLIVKSCISLSDQQKFFHIPYRPTGRETEKVARQAVKIFCQ